MNYCLTSTTLSLSLCTLNQYHSVYFLIPFTPVPSISICPFTLCLSYTPGPSLHLLHTILIITVWFLHKSLTIHLPYISNTILCLSNTTVAPSLTSFLTLDPSLSAFPTAIPSFSALLTLLLSSCIFHKSSRSRFAFLAVAPSETQLHLATFRKPTLSV